MISPIPSTPTHPRIQRLPHLQGAFKDASCQNSELLANPTPECSAGGAQGHEHEWHPQHTDTEQPLTLNRALQGPEAVGNPSQTLLTKGVREKGGDSQNKMVKTGSGRSRSRERGQGWDPRAGCGGAAGPWQSRARAEGSALEEKRPHSSSLARGLVFGLFHINGASSCG